MNEIIRAAAITGFRRLVRDLGGDPGHILRSVGLNDAMLAEPDRYIPYRNVVLAFEEAARVLGIPDFGLRLAARQDMNFLGTLALAIQSASSVRDGLAIAARNIHFHTPSISMEGSGSDPAGYERFRLDILFKEPIEIPQAAEHAIAHMCKVVRVLSDNQVRPSRIHFRHRKLARERCYVDHLGTVPRFASGFDGIELRSDEIRKDLPTGNRQLQGFVERFLIGVAPPSDLALPDQVRDVLRQLMRVQQPGLEDISRVLRLHPRTLQRRLKASGTTFESIQDEMRRELAESLLGQGEVPLAVVAQSAGFSDQPAFNRACRRWFGMTPGSKRKTWQEDHRTAQFGAA
ncbi:AraC family transcriptional regulator [Tsuneonella mangrovi]|uniref:AraC family transcriptional regulator n=1 Tax=Tsuneonella mangrovi TaxID=1982042 RepID=UPI000BA22AE3|nr:AraC family transcriptional regulator [Tsuneonella mangrovi]